MLATDLTPLRATILRVPVHRKSVEGRRCREYVVTDDVGNELLIARAFTWHREIVVTRPDGTPFLSILRSRAFPLNGRADVRELPTKQALGRVYRNGSFTSPSGTVRGRFHDARSMGERTRVGVLQGVVDVIVDAGGESMVSGPDTLVLRIDDEIRGTLAYAALPSPRRAEPLRASRWWYIMPDRLRAAWRRLNAPRGWTLTRATSADDPRLEIAAALFTAELSRW